MNSEAKDQKWLSGELGMKGKFRCMYLNTDMHDVEFIINGEAVGAHKVVLAISSPVFSEMFKSTATVGKTTIDIEDFTSVDAFREFIKFIYLEEADITMDNVFPLVYLSKHYNIPNLEMICISYAVDRVCPENLSHVLDVSLKLNLHQLAGVCKQMLSENCQKMIRDGQFSGISYETLKYIIQLDDLMVSETELALAVLQWCQEEVTRKPQIQDEATGDMKRSTVRNVIGDSLYLIRFPCMDEAVFAAKIAHSGLLSLKEVRDVFCYFCYKRMQKSNENDEATKVLEQLVKKVAFPVESRNSMKIESNPIRIKTENGLKRGLDMESLDGKKGCRQL